MSVFNDDICDIKSIKNLIPKFQLYIFITIFVP